ncbi:MAG: amidase domain-containing protein [Cellulosilyticaceae bacterium]
MVDAWTQIKEIIQQYYRVYYEMLGQQNRNPYKMQHFFATTFRGNKLYKKEWMLLQNQIQHNKEQPLSLLFQQPQVTIEWHSIVIYGTAARVALKVYSRMDYEGYTPSAILCSGYQEIELTSKYKRWYIENKVDEEMYKMESKGKKRRRQERGLIRERKEEKEVKGAYNREKAVAYAKQYAITPNTQKWKYYGGYGGDCTNFVSQCLYAGNIPFDNQGEDVMKKWYWYSDDYRTPSWTSADAFKFYMLNNKGYGLVAKLSDLQHMVPGDVIQLGTLEKTTHSMLVMELIYKDDTKQEIVDVLVAQHSIEGGISGYNIPLSTKIPPKLYFKILGYNPIYT